jgi:hypothetical protein
MSAQINGGLVRYGLPGLVLGLAVSWMSGARGPVAVAQTPLGGNAGAQAGPTSRGSEPGRALQGQLPGKVLASGDSNGTLAMVASPAGSTQWLYLVDTKSKAIAIYRLDPTNSKGALKLEAARQYQWDLKLEHYNNQAPEPAAIEGIVTNPARSTTQ